MLRAVVDDELLQLGIVLIVVRIQVGVALDVDTRDRHRQALAVHELANVHAAIGIGHLDAFTDADRERRQRQLVLGIAQDVHSWPGTPVLQSVVDVVHLLLGSNILSLIHELVALDSEFATLLQILILVDERVDGLQVARLAHLVHVLHAVLLRQIVCTDAGSRPILMTEIPVVQRLIVTCLDTQHMQQVAAEDMAVGTFHEGWFVAFGCLMRELLFGLHRLGIILCGDSFILGFVGVVGT